MARGSEAKSARKQARKEARAKEAERLLNGHPDDINEFAQPNDDEDNADDDNDDEDDDEDEDDADNVTSNTTTKISKSNRAKKVSSQRTSSSASSKKPVSEAGRIKTLPLVMLVMLTGTTLLPALLYLSDYLGKYAQKKHFLGSLGHTLGIGPSPKKRVLSFYEKHDPGKLSEVPSILAKYYGDYPKLIQRLERKYHDYGYFLQWEEDDAPMMLAWDKLLETRDTLQRTFQKYAPAVVKTGVRNAHHNIGFLYKKGKRAWKKQIWPVLQPYLGVPDAKTARKQKLMDKKEAEKRKKKTSGGGRRRSAEFRDEEEHDEPGRRGDEM